MRQQFYVNEPHPGTVAHKWAEHIASKGSLCNAILPCDIEEPEFDIRAFDKQLQSTVARYKALWDKLRRVAAHSIEKKRIVSLNSES